MLVPDSLENRDRCICRNCSSYPVNCGLEVKSEILYCGTAQSECDIEKNSCLCPNCPIFEELGLTETYYCETGYIEQ